ncbi:MAG: N-acetylneuraminate synthase family protein [Spirochaetaceae bacterium]|jgi:sialic acid synthase SpsE|nr:N-acetylneuraminate synthase family protein [Spirochaetaceae bacterium]
MRRRIIENNAMSFEFKLKNTSYSPKHTLIIAELGTSHNGDIIKAQEMVAAAAEAGADCIKTQIVYADEILHPNTGFVPLPGGDIKLYDVFKKLEVPTDFYARIKESTEAQGLLFLATPFGEKSADELFSLSPDFVKIASPELNYVQLLQKIALKNIPVLLSSGVSKLSDIENALRYFDKKKVCLLHCVTAYPAPEDDYNINLLRNLSGIFGVSVGLSDHSLDPVLVPLLAVSCGAVMIEKHFCLSRRGGGLDDPVALVPQDFARMSAFIRVAEAQSSEAIIEMAKTLFGREKVDSVLGDGIKSLSRSEKENYQRTNRSIHALREIEKGELFTMSNIGVLRTEKILRPGLHPSFFEQILGRAAGKTIPSGEGVRFEDI